MNDFYVYVWTNKINGKRYVGKGHGSRAHSHTRGKGAKLLTQSMRKHGIENFELTFLHENLAEDEAFELETFYITGLKTNVCDGGVGFNMTNGGEGKTGHKASEETRRRMSESQQGRTLSDESRHKISLAVSNPSDETRRKIREARKRQIITEEHRNKMSEAMKGRELSEDHKQKVSAALRGRTFSDEARRRMSESARNRRKKQVA